MGTDARFAITRNLISAALLAGGLTVVATAGAALVTIGNGIYEVHVNNTSGAQIGSWNAVTGPANPVSGGRDITYDATTVTTNFSSLRIFGPAAPATFTFGGAGGGTNLDPFFVSSGASAFGTAANSLRQTWNVTPFSLTLTQDLIATGTTFNNSAIYHSIALTNNGTGALTFGWRNLYDWAVNDPGFDDGPNNRVELGNGTVLVPATTNEFAFTPVPGALVRVSVDPGVPSYQPLLGIGFDPGFIPGLPVVLPTEYDFASWPSSFGTAFDYTTTGANVTGDSDGLTWWGRNAGSALTLAPGATIRLTEVIFGVPPNAPPPGTTPEPGTLALLGLGLAGLWARQRRRA